MTDESHAAVVSGTRPAVAEANARAAATLAADCISLATVLALLLGFLSLFPAVVVSLVGPRGVSTAVVVWQFIVMAPAGIFWVVLFQLWIGGLLLQRRLERGRRLIDIAAWVLLIAPPMWLSRVWGEWFADRLLHHYNDLPTRRWEFLALGVAFLMGMMLAVSLKRRVWSEHVLAACGRAPVPRAAPFTRITLFELFLLVLATVGAGILLGCWIGWRS